MNIIKIYLDNCCYNRPYDDQTQLRIELETKAKLHIQQQVVEKEILLVSSDILEFENKDNPYLLRKSAIKSFLKNASEYVDMSEEIINSAREINQKGIKIKDASHLACAIFAQCDYFLTTDDKLLKYKNDKIRILNPIDFIMIRGGSET